MYRSYHWYKRITWVNEQLGSELQKINVADREADIYELFFCASETNTDLLIRAKHNPKLNDGSALGNAVAGRDEVATIALKIPDKTGSKKSGDNGGSTIRQCRNFTS
ncbi:MAG: hypothetical protein H7Z13_05590 [Ferruginibacter sp.]|nr:hypothetical protein [Ferruginibacter sp.]